MLINDIFILKVLVELLVQTIPETPQFKEFAFNVPRPLIVALVFVPLA